MAIIYGRAESEKELGGTYNNWFVCNENAVCSILHSSDFKNIIKSGGYGSYGCFICDPDNDKQKLKYSHNILKSDLTKWPN